MRIILFSLFLLAVASLVPNCAYETNNKCLSCYYRFELVSGRCDKCITGFVMMNEVCISQGIYQQQQALQQQLAGSTSSTSSSTLQQTQGFSGFSTGSTSVLQSQTAQANQGVNTPQTVTQSSNNVGSSGASLSSSMVTFDIGNTGVMYLLNMFGLAGNIPANCITFTPDFKCVKCGNGFVLLNAVCFLQATTTTATNIFGSSSGSGNVGISGSTTNSQSTTSNSGSTPNSGSSFSSFGSQSSAPVLNSDSNCQSPNSDGSCSQCYFRYFYSSDVRKCVTVNPQCATWDKFGNCLSCYQGYKLSGTGCLLDSQSSASSQSSPSGQSSGQSSSSSLLNSGASSTGTTFSGALLISADSNCRTVGSTGVCSECYYSYFVNPSSGVCVPVNPQCQTWNNLGYCLSCYSGYVFSGTTCIIGSSGSSVNSGSSSSSGSGTSSGSSPGASSGSVIQWNSGSPSSGNFGSSGFSSSPLNGVITGAVMGSDPNCRSPNSDGSCSQCYNSFYYDSINARRCVSVNPLCRSWNNLGNCLSCYQGYNLFNNNCVMESAFQASVAVGANDLPSTNQDPSCNIYKDGFCAKCATRTYLDSVSKRCLQIDANCKSWTDSGICTGCFDGFYIFNQRECRLIYPEVSAVQLKSSLNSDVNCRASDSNGACTQCIWRFVLGPSRVCLKVSDLCKKWSQNNALCTECYGGYSLTNNGECKVSW